MYCTLPSLMLTRIRFFIQVKVTGTVEVFAEHSSDRLVPAMRGEPILSSDRLTLGAAE